MEAHQLQLVSQLCTALFGPDAEKRKQADAQLSPLCRVESLGQLRIILDTSTCPYAQYFVASSLLRLVADHWNLLQDPQKLELQQWLLKTIATKGTQMERHNLLTIVQVLCRLIKLGWLEIPSFAEVPGEVHKFFFASPSPEAITVGLVIFNSLIQEMNQVAARHTLTQHRKTSVAFRDTCLFDIFTTALLTLQSLRADPSKGATRLGEQGLALALNCLTFDFVGIFPDDSSDEVGTVQIPNSWRTVIIDPNTLQLLWDLYAALPPPRSTDALRCIVQFISIRRSIFLTDEERRTWLGYVLAGMVKVLKAKTGLDKEENYQEFCRLLSRIKPNYQLAELVSVDSYLEWVELCAQFTVDSFINWQATHNSHSSLLTLWARLVSSQPYLKGDKPSRLETYVPQITQAFVQSRLEMAAALARTPDLIDNPLDTCDGLLVQLEHIPVLARSCYDISTPFLMALMAPIMQEFQAGTMITQMTDDVNKKFEILELQLCWLVYIIGSIVGQHGIGATSADSEKNDGDLTAAALQLSKTVTERRVGMPGALASTSLQHLEMSLLAFLQHFRRVHIGESSMPASKVFPRLKELLGLEDYMAVLNVMVTKIVANFKAWRSCSRIIGETLHLFCDLSAAYSSGRWLLKLQSVRYMLENHRGPEFPFLEDQLNTKLRSDFYRTLANLLFMETVSEQAFEKFMQPLHGVCESLAAIAQPEALAQPPVKRAIVGLLRDLRGICGACMNRRTYTLLFDWLFPAHMPLLRRCCQVFCRDTEVAIPLLKFYADFVNSRSQRIAFDSNSANGILLFKDAAALLVLYGERALGDTAPIPEAKLYPLRYKGFYICMSILTRTLSGNYCNFGAMSHYNDTTLDQALDITIKMALSIRIADLLSYPKVGAAYFTLLETVFQSYGQILVALDTAPFMHLVHSLEEALRSPNLAKTAVGSATTAIGHLLSFYYQQVQKATPYAPRLNQHFSSDPELFMRLLNTMFSSLLFEDSSNQWTMSRPLLPLILIGTQYYEDYKSKMVASSGPDKKAVLQDAFAKLMDGVEQNLEATNRDKFTQNLTAFRRQAKLAL
jgi:exportin-7